jgi:hypothetical protein
MRRERRAANVWKLKRDVRNIEVQIDEFVLHGFSVTDRYILGDAFLLEIEQMLNAPASYTFLQQDATLSVVNAGKIAFPSNIRPTSVGKQVARAVYRSLNNVGGRKR